MKILIVYAHPSHKSYTYSILERLILILEEDDHQITISDLYAKDFSSDLSVEEYKIETSTFTTITVSRDVEEEQQLLLETDCVIFLYPVWWSDCPAKLKGWFDRVWSNGFAYSKIDEPRRLNTIKTGIAICPAGHTIEELERSGISQSMTTVMLDDRMGDRFENKHMMILAGTLIEDNKQEILKQVDEVKSFIYS